MENNLFKKACRTLELDKVLAMLAEQCVCDDAKQMARDIEPKTELGEVEAQISETTAAKLMLLRRSAPSFRGVVNIISSVGRAAAGSTLSARELINVGNVLATARGLIAYQENGIEMETCIDGLFASLSANSYLENRIFDAIVGEDEIADNASAELASIRRKIAATNQKIRDTLHKIVHSQQYQKVLQDSLFTIRSGRFVVPVKAESRGELPGIVHGSSSSGATLFIEPMPVVEANNELSVLFDKEKEEIERILAELSAETANFAESIAADYKIIVKLDFIFAKARLSMQYKGVQPQLNDDGIIDMKQCRHPLIPYDKVVPIDVRLGEQFDTLVITGPNTGGKTVSLKTLGLFSVMLQCGLHIPAAEGSRAAVFSSVYADIGDEQSIEQSLSTFSAHMTNIVAIMQRLDYRALVLFDELGAGTDPVEGASLAIAIIEAVRKVGARVAATTHYAEIKLYALETDGVENACCEFDVETLRPTYRLLTGVPGRSNAFAIAKRLGMSDEVIGRAKELTSEESIRFEDILTDLEKSRQQAERDRLEAEQARKAAERYKNQMEFEKREADKKLAREMDRLKADTVRTFEEGKKAIREMMTELDKLKLEKDASDFAEKLEQVRASVGARVKKLEAKPEQTESRPAFDAANPSALLPGVSVEIVSLGKTGVVETKPDNQGNVTVKVGAMKLKLHSSALRLVKEKAGPKSASSYIRSGDITRSVKMQLDLRGMNAEEAILELEQYIDDAMMASIPTVTIVHGKGTGVLRSAVHQALRSNKAVKGYRLGKYGEGENGVTIVNLQ